MFKFWRIEKRRRAIVMRENMARRTLIRANPQHGPFRPVDIYECSSDFDDEPTASVAPAASDVPTAAPGLPSQPVARVDRALDVLNAPGSSRPTSTPGTLVLEIEELSPELWEELRLDGAAEYNLYMQLNKTLIDPQLQTYPEPLYQARSFLWSRHQDHLVVLVDLKMWF